MSQKVCASCESTTSQPKSRKYPHWYKIPGTDKVVCYKCYAYIRKTKGKSRTVERICERCNETHSNQWYKTTTGWICPSCYLKEYLPKYHEQNKGCYIRYKGRRIKLPNNPRKGFCVVCNTKIDENLPLHHEVYHDDDPLKDTFELCRSCHAKTNPFFIYSKLYQRKGRVVKCDRCGKEFYKNPCRLKTERNFCSWKCYYPNSKLTSNRTNGDN